MTDEHGGGGGGSGLDADLLGFEVFCRQPGVVDAQVDCAVHPGGVLDLQQQRKWWHVFFLFPPLFLLAIKLTLSSYQHSMYWRVLKNSLRLNFGAFERLYFLYFIYLFIFTLIRYFCVSLFYFIFFFFWDVTLALRSAMVAK